MAAERIDERCECGAFLVGKGSAHLAAMAAGLFRGEHHGEGHGPPVGSARRSWATALDEEMGAGGELQTSAGGKRGQGR